MTETPNIGSTRVGGTQTEVDPALREQPGPWPAPVEEVPTMADAIRYRRTCTVDGCENVHLANGLCRLHYERVRRGKPLTVTPPRALPTAERLLSSIVRTPEGCWEWRRSLAGHRKEYGQIRHHGRMWYAHRAAYDVFVGAIPTGCEIDHLCRNTFCVNPAHLEPVTPEENQRRAIAARRAS